MSFEMAKEIILKEAHMVAESDRFDEIQVDFMGGEPLIRNILFWEQVMMEMEACNRRIEELMVLRLI